jgi:hypothetical protein
MPMPISRRCFKNAPRFFLMLLLFFKVALGVLDEDAQRAGFSGKCKWLLATLWQPPACDVLFLEGVASAFCVPHPAVLKSQEHGFFWGLGFGFIFRAGWID